MIAHDELTSRRINELTQGRRCAQTAAGATLADKVLKELSSVVDYFDLG
jgi:hypothetical protein